MRLVKTVVHHPSYGEDELKPPLNILKHTTREQNSGLKAKKAVIGICTRR